MALTVGEAAATYEKAMRNVLPAGPGICVVCHTFIDREYSRCYRCGNQPSELDAVVPITYSEHLSQMHTVLRQYKDAAAPKARAYMMTRLAAILWRFLEAHESHVAVAAEAQKGHFDVVVTVPSSTPERDEQRSMLRWIVGEGCGPTSERYERVLRATGKTVPGRAFDPIRYTATESLDGLDVLLVDDTWAAGGHAQSAGFTLKEAGARKVGLVAIGRHVRPDWVPTHGGPSCSEIVAGLPKTFDWETCCVHPEI